MAPAVGVAGANSGTETRKSRLAPHLATAGGEERPKGPQLLLAGFTRLSAIKVPADGAGLRDPSPPTTVGRPGN